MILPLFDDGRVLLERQFRYPIGKVLLEFPAGKLDPNEDELTCAKRELQEETGYTAREWFFLTRIHPVISYSTEFIDLYLARGLTEGERKLDDGEFLETFIADAGAARSNWVKSGKHQRREDDHRRVLARENPVGRVEARRSDRRLIVRRSTPREKRPAQAAFVVSGRTSGGRRADRLE